MTRLHFRTFALSLVTLLAVSSRASAEDSFEELFFKANQAYKQGQYEKAADGYNALIARGLRSGDLYYNLANTYFRLHRLGPAILNYERARLLIPGDADLRFNLGLARDQTQDVATPSGDTVHMVFFWLDGFSEAAFFRAFAAVNVLFSVILTIRLFRRPEWTFYVGVVALLFWIVLGASFAVKWHDTHYDDRAVVLAPEADVLAGPDPADTCLFKLHEGTIVHQERSEDGWTLIHLDGNKRGWLPAETIKPIALNATPSFRTPSR